MKEAGGRRERKNWKMENEKEEKEREEGKGKQREWIADVAPFIFVFLE